MKVYEVVNCSSYANTSCGYYTSKAKAFRAILSMREGRIIGRYYMPKCDKSTKWKTEILEKWFCEKNDIYKKTYDEITRTEIYKIILKYDFCIHGCNSGEYFKIREHQVL